jgi:two-component system alkaline phosphatase synthesis response regulator PhoP
VLVVDDSADVRELWSMWLQFWGFAVEQATNGLEAIKTARTFQPHLVLMDLWMPIVDGLKATETLKADPHMKDVPVLALSADTFSAVGARALQAGADRFIAKPVNPDVLLQAVRDLLRALIRKTPGPPPAGC